MIKASPPRYAAPLDVARPRGARLLEAFSLKLGRRVRLFDRASFDQWVRLEADSQVVSLCERPARLGSTPDARLIDFWVLHRDGEQFLFIGDAEPCCRPSPAWRSGRSPQPSSPPRPRGLPTGSECYQSYDVSSLGARRPLMRRPLAIDEASFGAENANVAIPLSNLAQLLTATKRLAEAEPLMRRALAIFVASLGPERPNSQIVAGELRGSSPSDGEHRTGNRGESRFATSGAVMLTRPLRFAWWSTAAARNSYQ